jgi:UDP-N-acetylmuramyl pentapeptide synthase
VTDPAGGLRPLPGWRRWLGVGALVAAIVLAFAVGYQRGQIAAGLNAASVARERRDLEAKVELLEDQKPPGY